MKIIGADNNVNKRLCFNAISIRDIIKYITYPNNGIDKKLLCINNKSTI